MVTLADLAAYLGAAALPEEDAAPVLDAASQLVSRAIGTADVPEVIRSQAVVIVAAELWRRRDAPGGVVNAWGDTSYPVRLALDPLTPALPLLRPWMAAAVA